MIITTPLLGCDGWKFTDLEIIYFLKNRGEFLVRTLNSDIALNPSKRWGSNNYATRYAHLCRRGAYWSHSGIWNSSQNYLEGLLRYPMKAPDALCFNKYILGAKIKNILHFSKFYLKNYGLWPIFMQFIFLIYLNS